MTESTAHDGATAPTGGEPTRPEPDAPHPQPVDPVGPLKRDPDEAEETHPGADPVVRPVPPG